MDVLQDCGVLPVVLAVLLAAFLARRALRPRPRTDLRGKVVLLTGAGGGLGRQLARRLWLRGCSVACVDVAPEPNEETVALLQPAGQQQEARAYTADLSDREAIYGLVRRVVEDFGRVDILLSNAGQLQGGALWECTDDQLDRVLDVNLRATLRLVRGLMPHMRERGEGHVVAVSSFTARVPGRAIIAYSCSKAGLSHAMECLYHDLRLEGLHDKIHVTTVQPFFINTFARLGNTVRFAGFLGFLEPGHVAEEVVRAIEARKHVLNLPGHMTLGAPLLGLLPRAVLAFVHDLTMRSRMLPAFSYEHRHKALDAAVLHELLSKGYPLEEDPAAVCAGLCADPAAARAWDFAPYARQVADYYRQRGQDVPAAVKKVFGVG